MIGKKLEQLRLAHGIKTKADAARLFNMPYTTYVNYETDAREPGSAELMAFARKYNVTIDYLLGIEKKPLANNDEGLLSEQKQAIDKIKKLKNPKSIQLATAYLDLLEDQDSD